MPIRVLQCLLIALLQMGIAAHVRADPFNPVGACCLEGPCQILPRLDCFDAGGIFQGEGTSCVFISCTDDVGACCFRDGACSEVAQRFCVGAGETFFGAAVGCAMADCTMLTGSCCFLDTGCFDDVEQQACEDAVGLFLGHGLACTDASCDPGDSVACCLPDGTCVTADFTACSAAGGVSRLGGCGDVCSGACCLPDGGCVSVDAGACLELFGTYSGLDTDCAIVECAVVTVLYVDPNGDDSDGTSWEKAFRTVSQATTRASVPGNVVEEVRIAGGTYITAGSSLRSGVVFRGGYAGAGAPDPDHQDPAAYPTVFTGDLNGDDGPDFSNYEENASGLLSVFDATLEDVRITHARGDAVIIDDGTLRRCIIDQNLTAGGPAIVVTGAALIEDCLVTDNGAMGSGAAVVSLDGQADGAILRGTQVLRTLGTTAIRVWGAVEVTIEDCVVADTIDATAVWASVENLSMTGCHITRTVGGRALLCFSHSVFGRAAIITDTVIDHTSSDTWAVDVAESVLDGVTIAHNLGGGLFVSGDLVVTNSIIAFNRVVYDDREGTWPTGAGVVNLFAHAQLFNTVIYGNIAEGSVGGIIGQGGTTLTNCVLWANKDASGTGFGAASGSIPDFFSCCVQGLDGALAIGLDVADGASFEADPLFIDPVNLDFRLHPASPCIDAGTPVGVLDAADLDGDGVTDEPLPLDAEGGPRFLDDPVTPNGPAGEIIDIGPLEFADADCNNNGIHDRTDTLTGEQDCNANGLPDACESLPDCDDDGTADVCELAGGMAEDCNGNGVPDACDIALGMSFDEDLDGTPDECQPLILFVDASATGIGTGASWPDACADLQDALDVAEARPGHTEIWVAAGTYRPAPPDGQRNIASFRMRDNTDLYGGFDGTETERDQRDPAANPTILSGDLNANDDPGFPDTLLDNSYHVVVDGGAEALLDGFMITGGNADEVQVRPIMQRSNPGYPHNAGGGLLVGGNGLRVVDCVVHGNTASSGAGLLSVRFVTIIPPAAVYRGVRFEHNTGGPIVGDRSGRSTFDRCVIANNDGHAINSRGVVANSLVVNNTANGFAAGFAQRWVNCTIAGNHATEEAGGIAVGEDFDVVNCIIWGNTTDDAGADPNLVLFGPLTTGVVAYNLIEGWAGEFDGTGPGNSGASPNFTDPIGPDGISYSGDEDLRPLAFSAAIDSGDSAALPLEARALDLGGMARLVDDPRIADTGPLSELPPVDRGAYELTPICGGDVNGDGSTDTADLSALIGAFGSAVPAGTGADFNGDGAVNAADLSVLITNFGCGPIVP